MIIILVLVAGSASADLFLANHADLPSLSHAIRVHDYGGSMLVSLPPLPSAATGAASRLRLLPDATRVSFRSWHGVLAETDWDAVRTLVQGTYVLGLTGPLDPRWRAQLDDMGVRVVGWAHPHALVVEADGRHLLRTARLVTSEGSPVVLGITPLPGEARRSRDLLTVLARANPARDIAVRVQAFGGAPAPDKSTRLGGDYLVSGTPAEILELLASSPEIAYVEPLYEIELHNNIAAQDHLVAAAAVWQDLGVDGSAIVVNHNDTGVDLSHPDLPPEAIVATVGVMAYTDTGHGTHTAASVAGRGMLPSPLNTWECGDVVAPLASLRGMAWGARLAVNNIMDGGYAELADMMQWGVRHGASISANSWGQAGPSEIVATYNSAAVAADLAARDADPNTPGNQEIAIVFSAGNTGPAWSTVTSPATAKNVITAGATHNDRCGSYVPQVESGPDPTKVADLSGRGPSQGRIKPELVSPGIDVLSAQSLDVDSTAPWDQDWTGDEYTLGSGTSMACPVIAGAAALFQDAYYRSHAVVPSPALTRAALVNGAIDLGRPREEQGWGRVNALQTIAGPPNGRATFVEQELALTTGARWTDEFLVFSAAEALRITLAWTDVPGEADADHPLVNDLDLVVTDPGGLVYRGNVLDGAYSAPDPGPAGDSDNNLENVFVEQPETGTWTVEVVAVNVAENPPGLEGQDFAFVISGDAASCVAPQAPSDLAAASVGDNRIDITWAPTANATEYAVLRSTESGGRPYFPIATLAAPTTEFSDLSVSGGIIYYYVVRAFTDCWSADSSEASATASGLCNLAPIFAGLENVVDAKDVTCSLDLSWSPATSPCTDQLSYSIYRSDEPEFNPGPEHLVAAGVTETSYRVSELVHGRRTHFLVRAFDPLGSDDGNTVVRGGVPSGPDAVYLLENAESGPDSWLAEAASDADPGSDPWAIETGDSRSPSRAWHCADADDLKDQALTMREPIEIPRDAPIILEFWHRHVFESRWDGGRLEYSSDGGTTWQDILAGDGFVVPADPDRFAVGGYTDTLALGGSGNPLAGQLAWTGASSGWERQVVTLEAFAGEAILLRWRLGCDDGGGAGSDGGWWVDDIRILAPSECQSCQAPAAPSEVAASASEAGILITWAPVDGATSYHLMRSAESGGPYTEVAALTTELQHLDTMVSGATTYSYVVSAVTDCRSGYSEEARSTAHGSCSLAPTFWGLAAVDNPGDVGCGLDLSWAPAGNRCPGSGVAYRIHRSAASGFAPDDANFLAETTATRFRDLQVSDSETYAYLVRAFDRRSRSEDDNLRTRSGRPTGPVVAVFSDDMEGGSGLWEIATGSAADTGTEPWILGESDSSSPSHAWFVANVSQVMDQVLEFGQAVVIPTGAEPVLVFDHVFELESFWDGGRLEYSTDGGQTWQDILDGDGSAVLANPDRFLTGRYSAILSAGTGSNPLAGTAAWTGALETWQEVRVDLRDFSGLSLHFRWRMGSDDSRSRTGWWVDDVRVEFTSACETTGTRRPGQRVP